MTHGFVIAFTFIATLSVFLDVLALPHNGASLALPRHDQPKKTATLGTQELDRVDLREHAESRGTFHVRLETAPGS